jgi:hypothetical protein
LRGYRRLPLCFGEAPCNPPCDLVVRVGGGGSRYSLGGPVVGWEEARVKKFSIRKKFFSINRRRNFPGNKKFDILSPFFF